jgi:iron(III) transport system substrate-binding protein
VRRLVFLLGLLHCGDPAREEVVAYVSLDRMFSEPILQEFEKRTGIHVVFITDTEATKTTGLVERLIMEKDRPVADVFWNSEIIRTIVLKRKGILEHCETDAPLRDPDGYWSGFAARARVILYNTNLVQEPPRSLEDFTRPQWKARFAIAKPLFGTTATQVAAMFAENPEKAEALLKALKANDAQIVDGNAMARNDVMDGRIAACFTDTDDANEAMLDGKPVKMVYPEPTLLIPNTVAMIKGGPHPANAKKLIEYLVSREVEAALAKSKSAQIPLRPGVPPFSPEFDLARIHPMKVDFDKVADALDRSTAFVRDIFIR